MKLIGYRGRVNVSLRYRQHAGWRTVHSEVSTSRGGRCRHYFPIDLAPARLALHSWFMRYLQQIPPHLLAGLQAS
ncbi:Uncharacterised protein [Mycobacteroides abscessus subsp. abscessus]|nr:Uncharacterised protein [Mycobacteroides abscessus subsp. abscessus]